jgi:DNA polymerase III sliding clamp (beta) subunit (PCNA family)
MRFVINSKLLSSAIKDFMAVFSQGLDIKDVPCRITTNNKGITLESSGGGVYLSKKLPAKVASEGKFDIVATNLASLNFPGVEIDIEARGNALSYKSGRVKASLNILGAKAEIARVKDTIEDSLVISPSLFDSLVSALLIFPLVADQPTQLRISASKKKDTFCVVTSDKYRVAVYTCKSSEVTKPKEKAKKAKKQAPMPKDFLKVSGSFDCTFPGDFLKSIRGMFGDSAEIRIGSNDKAVRFSNDDTMLYHPVQVQSLGEDSLKTLNKIMEKDPIIHVDFDPAKAIEVLGAVSSISKSDDVKFEVEVKDKEVVFSIRTLDKISKAIGSFDPIKVKATGQFLASFSFMSEYLESISKFASPKRGVRLLSYKSCIVMTAGHATLAMTPVGE